MAAIRSQDTKPELVIRRLLHRLGYRYRLHRKDLPGKPDMVFPGRRKVIEVRGCYWHGHGCAIGRPAQSNTGYWAPKIARNKERDAANLVNLHLLGWDVLELWECSIRKNDQIEATLRSFLGERGRC